MARTKREQSETGIYHILLRGVNTLFSDNNDYEAFFRLLKKHSDEGKIKVLSYLLLNNRIHLLVDSMGADIGMLLKPICTSYARYHNRTRAISGKLFYDRLKSEPINSKEELRAVVAFINKIAVLEGREKEYSSLNNPLCTLKDSGLTEAQARDTNMTEMFAEDYDRLSKKELTEYIFALSGVYPKDFKALSAEEQNVALMILTKKYWISKSKIYELLGIKRPQTIKGTVIDKPKAEAKKITNPPKKKTEEKPKEEKAEEIKEIQNPKPRKKDLSVWLL